MGQGGEEKGPTVANPVLAILIWPIWANPILANPIYRPTRLGLVPELKLKDVEPARRDQCRRARGAKCSSVNEDGQRSQTSPVAPIEPSDACWMENSAGRQALEGAELAPGSEATKAALTHPEKRPKTAREPLPDRVAHNQPVFPVEVDMSDKLQQLAMRRHSTNWRDRSCRSQ